MLGSRIRRRAGGDDPSRLPPQLRKPADPTSIDGVPSYIPVANMGPSSMPNLGLPSGFDSKFDNEKGYKINLDSNGPMNHAVQLSSKSKKQREKTGIQMLTFAKATKSTAWSFDLGEVDLLSWSALNHALKYDYEMLVKYDGADCRALSNEWRHVGTQIREQTIQQTQALHIFRRAINYNLHCALNNRTTQRGSVRPMDDLWILVVRLQCDYSNSRMENQSAGFLPGAKRPQHYWQLLPFVSTDGSRPRHELYSQSPAWDEAAQEWDDGWTGDAIFLGTVSRIFGDSRSTSNTHCNNARMALCPETLDDEAKKNLYSLSQYEIFRL